jgi:glycerol uptake facilitator-like aquaporin
MKTMNWLGWRGPFRSGLSVGKAQHTTDRRLKEQKITESLFIALMSLIWFDLVCFGFVLKNNESREKKSARTCTMLRVTMSHMILGICSNTIMRNNDKSKARVNVRFFTPYII